MPKVSQKQAAEALAKYQVENPSDGSTITEVFISWLEADEGAFEKYVNDNNAAKPSQSLEEFKNSASAKHSLQKSPSRGVSLAKLSPEGLEIIRFCAYLNPENVPQNLLAQMITEDLRDEALFELRSQSLLIEADAKGQLFRIHRLLQEAVRRELASLDNTGEIAKAIVEKGVDALKVIVGSHEAMSRAEVGLFWKERDYLNLQVVRLIAEGENLKISETLLATLLEWAGEYQEHIAFNFTESLNLYQRSLEIRKVVYTGNHQDLATSLFNVGNIYCKQGQYDQALEHFQQALTMRQAVYGDKHPAVARSLCSIGTISFKLDQYDKALEHYEQALNIRRATYGDSHPDVAMSLSNIGDIYKAKGQYDQALDYYQQALAMSQAVYDDKHPDVATSFSDIGGIHEAKDQYDQALDYYQQALAMSQAVYGDKHPDVAWILGEIGGIYSKQDHHGKALEHYEQALAIDKVNYGDKHLNVAVRLSLIGGLYHRQIHYDQALKYYQQALVAYKAAFDNKHKIIVSIFNVIGDIYLKQYQYDKAIDYYQQALAMYKVICGDEHPDVAERFNQIGNLYLQQGHYDKALEYCEQALAINKTTYGDKHTDVADSLGSIGTIYASQDQYDQALEYYRQSLAVYKANDDKNIHVAVILENIGTIYAKQDQHDQALDYYQQALAIYKVNDDRNPNIANIFYNSGTIHEAQSQHDQALECYQQALAICKDTYGDKHPHVALNLTGIGNIYHQQDQCGRALEHYEQALAISKVANGAKDQLTAMTTTICKKIGSVENNLFIAAEKGLVEIIKMLLSLKIQFKYKDGLAPTGAMTELEALSIRLQRLSQQFKAFESGLTVAKIGAKDCLIATEIAIKNGHAKIVGLLLENEVDAHIVCEFLLTLEVTSIKKEVVLTLLQRVVEQNSKSSNAQQSKDFPILKLFVAPELPFGINVEDIKQCFSEIKDDLERLNDWLSRTSEDSSIHVIVSDIVLKNIKRQQLQKQQNDAYFISSSVELKKQLKKLVSPNHLEIYKNQAIEHVLQLARRRERVDNLITLLNSCLEPAMFLNSYRPSWFFGQTRESFLIARLGAKIKELNWAITQHQRSLEYGDICTDLAAIRDIYISYKDEFSGVYNSKPSIERDQKLKLICEHPYMLGIASSRDYLREEPILHLAPKEGKTEVTESENKFGTHIVRQYGGIHFKYHMETAPCYPAVEYMVGSLYNMLAGASYGIAPTEIVKLYRPGCIDKPEYAQVLVASQSVEGVNLFDFLLRHARNRPEYLQKFDLYSFSAMVITSLLSNPADGKADNYMVSFMPHENSDTNEDNFKIKIVGIDNDLSFASPIIKKHTGKRAGQHFVEVQSVFYFFPQMQEKIHPKPCDYLINQSVELLLINFIKSLQTQNQKYENLKGDGLLTESEWKSMGLPICFPSNDSLVLIYHKLIKIQSYLSKNKDANHAALFENLYPEMFAYYQQISSLESTEATAILDKFCKLAAAAAPSLEDAGIIMDRKDRRLTSKIAFKTMQNGGYLNKAHTLAETVAEFIKALDFAKIPSIDLQRTILETLKELNCLEQLTLRNCRGLDDSLLIALATSLPKLKSIHLVGCPNVTIDGVLTTYDTNMHAKKLSFGLSRCAKITERQYQQMADIQVPLELLAKDSQNKYYGFPWGRNANTILHQIVSHSLNLSLSIEQMRFLIVKGLDINSHNDGQTSLNGYTALHIAAVNRNSKMLGLLLALGADPQKLDKHSQETPFQKAAKRNLFMPCYALSQAKNTILSNQERQNLSDLTVREIQSAYRSYRGRKLNFKQ